MTPTQNDRSGPRARAIALRLDRLPVLPTHWRLVVLAQFMWGSVLILDTMAARIYPVYWEPRDVMSQIEYSVVVGMATGFGPLIGGVLFGVLADRFGRKPMMMLSCAVASFTVWPAAISTSYPVILACVSVSALGIGGALAIVPAYNSEWCPPARRNRLMLGSQVLSQAMIAFVGPLLALAFLPDSVLGYVVVIAVLPAVAIIVMVAAMPESARWLAANGRSTEADRLVTAMERDAEARCGPLPPVDPSTRSAEDERRPRTLDVFRGAFKKRTLLLLTVWVFFYFGPGGGFTPFQSVYIVAQGYSASQLFLVLTIGGIGGVAGVLGAAWINERLERRQFVLIGALVFTGGALLYYVAAQSFAVLTIGTVLVMLGFGVMLNNLYNYSAAVFPTHLRAVGTGWADGVGHVSAVFGPLIAGAFYAATAGANHVGWFLWFIVVGSLAPALLLFFFGCNQRREALESTAGVDEGPRPSGLAAPAGTPTPSP